MASPSAVHPVSFVAPALLPMSELHDMLVAAVVPSTKVVADLFPLSLRAIPRGSKRPAPAPLRSRFAFGVAGPWPAAR